MIFCIARINRRLYAVISDLKPFLMFLRTDFKKLKALLHSAFMKAILYALSIVLITCSAQAEPPQYVIGAVLPLTGEAAEPVSSCRDAMSMSYDRLDPLLQKRLALIFEDTGFNPTKAVNAYRKLRERDHANVILTWDTPASNALAPLTEEDGIVLITQSLDPRVVLGRKSAFTYWVRPEAQADAMLTEAARRGYRNIARISALHDGLLAVKTGFDQKNQGRFKIVLDEEFPMDTKDFRPYLTKLRREGPVDAVFVNLMMGGQVGIFARQSREMGFNMPLFGPESFETLEDVKLSNGALIGQWYAQASDPSEDFIRDFKSRFPHDSMYSVGNCYDIITLVAQAAVEKQPLRDFLENLHDFKGVMGKISATGDHRFTLPVVIKRITENGFEVISK